MPCVKFDAAVAVLSAMPMAWGYSGSLYENRFWVLDAAARPQRSSPGEGWLFDVVARGPVSLHADARALLFTLVHLATAGRTGLVGLFFIVVGVAGAFVEFHGVLPIRGWSASSVPGDDLRQTGPCGPVSASRAGRAPALCPVRIEVVAWAWVLTLAAASAPPGFSLGKDRLVDSCLHASREQRKQKAHFDVNFFFFIRLHIKSVHISRSFSGEGGLRPQNMQGVGVLKVPSENLSGFELP